MASLTVRNVPEDAKRRFRQVAAAHGRSMEEHLRQLIISADLVVLPTAFAEAPATFRHSTDPVGTGSVAIDRLLRLGRGIEFDAPPRETVVLKDIDFG